MNSNLANQLLASIMKWDAPTLASERAALEFMGSMKYDAYDRYMPGMRFMSSLVQWLNQGNRSQFRKEEAGVHLFTPDELSSGLAL